VREYDRQRSRTETARKRKREHIQKLKTGNPERFMLMKKEAIRKSRKKHREKYLAWAKVGYALQNKAITNWKKPSSNSGSTISPAKQRQGFSPIVKLLDLPKTEMDNALDALGSRKRLMPSNFGNNVRDAVFWRIMEIKAQEFNEPKKIDAVCKEKKKKKYFGDYQNSNVKKVLEIFTGKSSVPADLAKMPSEKVFALLAAMEMEPWRLPDPENFAKGKANDVVTWAGLSNETLKQIYQEEIKKRIPKQKAEPKKLAEKKQAKAKTPTADKSAKKSSAKKPITKPAAKKPHTGLLQGKGKGKKK
jgi:hypothetical protein